MFINRYILLSLLFLMIFLRQIQSATLVKDKSTGKLKQEDIEKSADDNLKQPDNDDDDSDDENTALGQLAKSDGEKLPKRLHQGMRYMKQDMRDIERQD